MWLTPSDAAGCALADTSGEDLGHVTSLSLLLFYTFRCGGVCSAEKLQKCDTQTSPDFHQ